ncbi:hypothetical protein TKK_0007996 [Trichogramma kaykai]
MQSPKDRPKNVPGPSTAKKTPEGLPKNVAGPLKAKQTPQKPTQKRRRSPENEAGPSSNAKKNLLLDKSSRISMPYYYMKTMAISCAKQYGFCQMDI